MAEIQYLPKSNLTNGQLTTVARTVLLKLSEYNISPIDFKKQKDDLEHSTDDFENSQTKITEEVYTKEKIIIKNSLNYMRTGFFSLLKGDCTSENPERRKAALGSMPLAKAYANISRYIYDDLLTWTTRLINSSNESPYKEYITTLGYTGRITELQTKLNEGIMLKNKRFDASGMRVRVRKTSVTRKEVIEKYDLLVKRLNAVANYKGDADYVELFSWWNAMINEYRREISNRLGKGKGGSADNPENSQPNPDSGNSGSGSGGEDRPVIE
ncbi:hypothetical protein DXD68_22335 [Parabacteroides sp. TM07-1AC]|uniref:DUF6261 family protein n=1 Tax=Parabacteroides sp. TM07-1AC TaxID=2292363 RepID=UPI000EFE29B2|nr:DUF6261 family protein [Parabacteroides sp. TM07-1AC]RHU22288.1 hypothetical protein DXD68_22335 [Parabacteroides sp. TM07-1AC]